VHDRGARRPKIAELLAEPLASGAVTELKLARSLQVAPSILRGRRVDTVLFYEDPDHPDRVTRTTKSPAWTPDDRSLMLALAQYEATLCPGCGNPKDLAWHHDTASAWEVTSAVCHPCTARRLDGTEVVYQITNLLMPDAAITDLEPFEWGTTTTEPKPPPST
jgi:hypothetical protein